MYNRDHTLKTDKCPRCSIVYLINPESVKYHKYKCQKKKKVKNE